MKEYTITYKADITEIVKSDQDLKDNDPHMIANWIGSKLGVDDVHVYDVKVFTREVS